MLGNSSYGNLLTNSRFEWGVVNAPVGGSLANVNPDYALMDIFAIPSESRYIGAAMTFMTYAGGQGWAQSYAQSHPYNTISNPVYAVLEDQQERSLAPFYALEPAVSRAAATSLSNNLEAKLAAIVENETEKAVRNEKTVEEAIQAIATAGGQELMQAGKS